MNRNISNKENNNLNINTPSHQLLKRFIQEKQPQNSFLQIKFKKIVKTLQNTHTKAKHKIQKFERKNNQLKNDLMILNLYKETLSQKIKNLENEKTDLISLVKYIEEENNN